MVSKPSPCQVRGIALASFLTVGPIFSSQATQGSIQVTVDRPAQYGHKGTFLHDPAKLVDGRYATRHFWTSPETVGWTGTAPVAITFSFARPKPLKGICLSTASGHKANVWFPDRADVFLATPGSGYMYAGNMIREPPFESDAYATRKFCAAVTPSSVTKLLVLIKPGGPYLFLDEIEFIERDIFAAVPRLHPEGPIISEIDARQIHDHKFNRAQRERGLAKLTRRVQSGLAHAQAHESTAVLRKELSRLLAINERRDDDITDAKLDAWESDLFKAVGSHLASTTNKRVEVWTVSPWTEFSPVDRPSPQAISGDHTVSLDLIRGGHASAALAISNPGIQQTTYRLRSVEKRGESSPIVKLYESRFIQRASGDYVADALVPLTDGRIVIRGGESKQIWISLAANAAPSGTYGYAIEIFADESENVRSTVHIHAKVWPITLSAVRQGFSNSWAYLTWRPLSGIKNDAVRDLLDHHINVLEFSPSQIPWPRISLDGSIAIDDSAMDRFLDEVRLARKFKLAILFLHFKSLSERTFGGRVEFGSPEWKRVFRWWLDRLASELLNAGFTYDQFAFFPIDEPSSEEELRILNIAAEEIKRFNRRLLVYTTLGEHTATDVARHSANVDIFQVLVNQLDGESAKAVVRSKRRLWTYTANGGGKAGHPFHFYRKQAWVAFRAGAEGIGFWSYADTGPHGTGWSDTDGLYPDFSVIYEGPGKTIIPSKRWEAWREGTEDFELLTFAAKQLTVQSTRAALRSAIGRALSSTDYNSQFTDARRDILRLLSRDVAHRRSVPSNDTSK
jgi:hypothetical protein